MGSAEKICSETRSGGRGDIPWSDSARGVRGEAMPAKEGGSEAAAGSAGERSSGMGGSAISSGGGGRTLKAAPKGPTQLSTV